MGKSTRFAIEYDIMTKTPKHVENDAQAALFKEAAIQLGCNESEATFDAALKKVAAHKPVSEPPQPDKKSKTKKPAE